MTTQAACSLQASDGWALRVAHDMLQSPVGDIRALLQALLAAEEAHPELQGRVLLMLLLAAACIAQGRTMDVGSPSQLLSAAAFPLRAMFCLGWCSSWHGQVQSWLPCCACMMS